jgi:rod shape-determining protein MreD
MAGPMDPWRWIGVPVLLCVGGTVILATPVRLWGLQAPEPVFAMAPVFGWAMLRPTMAAPFAVLALGLFLDLFWGGPMGLWALSLLVAYGAVFSVRTLLIGQSQLMMAVWYGATCSLAFGAATLFTILDVNEAPDPLAVLWQMLATVVLYPFASRLIDRFEDADVRFR